MAKLERVTAKVFASDAPADKIGQFGSSLAGTKLETGDVSTIQALPAYTEGWSSAVISQRNYPVLQETNGVMKNMSYQTAYIMQNGIAEYDPDTEYYAGSICKGIGNTNQYASLGDENVGNAVTDSDYWKNVTPVNYSNITNCITEIPQRIKLELNNGVLTLKAGSVVIVPDGFEADGTTPKFDYETVESDISTSGGSAGTRFAFYHINAGSFLGVINTYVYSGDTAKMNSTPAATYSRFYNTQTNKIYVGNSNGGSWVETRAGLPICIFRNVETNIVASLDQVFNGIGYIDSLVWVDKDVKGLIPNGRNEDGTLNNIEYTHNRLEITSRSVTGYNPVIIGNSRPLTIGTQPYTESATPLPASGSGFSIYLNTYENIFYINNGSEWQASQNFLVATLDLATGGVINGLNPKHPFRAVDYSDCDGVWTAKNIVLAEEVKFSNDTETAFSLADYLPNDNNIYEVIISLAGSSSGVCHYNISTGYGTMVGFLTKGIAGAFITTPVSTARLLRFLPPTTASGTNKISVRVTAYRKVR